MIDDYLRRLDSQFSAMLAERERVNPSTPPVDPRRERVVAAVRVGCVVVFLVVLVVFVRGVTR